jgi:hypothetical protein
MFRLLRPSPGFYRKVSSQDPYREQISSYPRPGDFYSLMSWIQANTLPIPQEWEPYYRFMHGPMMGIPSTISPIPKTPEEFYDLARLYGAVQNIQENYRARQRFLERLMEAYGMGRGRINSPPSGLKNVGYWF